MGLAYLDGQKKSGGIKLNDVIEEYKYVAAGKEIKVGDFVNYINGIAGEVDYGESVDTVIDGTNTYAGRHISAVALDESRVFIAHSYSSNYHLYGVVCTINGVTITYGTDTQLSSTKNAGLEISACLLPNGNVFIAHCYSTNYNLYGMVCAVEGTTITAGTDTKLVTQTSTGQTISTCLLPNGNVFIAHSYAANGYLYGVVAKINVTEISPGTDKALNSIKENTGLVISTCLLPDGKVFIAHSYDSSYYLYGIVVSISGTTITKGSDTALNGSTTLTGRVISTCLLPNGNVFIAHSYSSDYKLYGIVVSISGTTITLGIDTLLTGGAYSGYAISTCLLPNGNVFIAHSSETSNYYLVGIVCTITGTTISKGRAKGLHGGNTYTGYAISTVLLDNGTVFIAHSNSSSYFLNAQIFGIDETNKIPTNNIVITEYETQVTPAEETPFDAIALSDGLGGTDTEHNEQVLIARPNVEVV